MRRSLHAFLAVFSALCLLLSLMSTGFALDSSEETSPVVPVISNSELNYDIEDADDEEDLDEEDLDEEDLDEEDLDEEDLDDEDLDDEDPVDEYLLTCSDEEFQAILDALPSNEAYDAMSPDEQAEVEDQIEMLRNVLRDFGDFDYSHYWDLYMHVHISNIAPALVERAHEVQARIDALPSVEEVEAMSDAEKQAVVDEFNQIRSLMEELKELDEDIVFVWDSSYFWTIGPILCPDEEWTIDLVDEDTPMSEDTSLDPLPAPAPPANGDTSPASDQTSEQPVSQPQTPGAVQTGDAADLLLPLCMICFAAGAFGLAVITYAHTRKH